jgi:hypothetical protein
MSPVLADFVADSPFVRDGEVVRRSYWLDMNDRTLVMVMTRGIGANLTNDEKRAHLIDLRRERLIDQACPRKSCHLRSKDGFLSLLLPDDRWSLLEHYLPHPFPRETHHIPDCLQGRTCFSCPNDCFIAGDAPSNLLAKFRDHGIHLSLPSRNAGTRLFLLSQV